MQGNWKTAKRHVIVLHETGLCQPQKAQQPGKSEKAFDCHKSRQ